MEAIQNTGTTAVRVNGRPIKPGEIVARGDIPDDAFDYLASRPDFMVVSSTAGSSSLQYGEGEPEDPIDESEG